MPRIAVPPAAPIPATASEYVVVPVPSAGPDGFELLEIFRALGQRWAEVTLPPSLDRLAVAIAQSKQMLDWAEDWDGEGSPRFQQDTWQRAVYFLVENSRRLWRTTSIAVDTPKILPGPDGGFDIHWKTGRRSLLINFPADISEPVTFYGDNKLGQSVKGVLDLRINNQWLLMWLMQQTNR